MKVVQGSWREWDIAGTGVAIGVFDGVHLGHRAVLARIVGGDDAAAVLTFDPHPVAVVAPEHAPPLLTSLERRLELFAEAGVEVTAVATFDERLRSMSPEAFCRELLVGGLGARRVVVGADFHFGRDRSGTPADLVALGSGLGMEVVVMPLVGEDDGISSSAIRTALRRGRVGDAAGWLGRPYRVVGTVVPGDGRGDDLGFPTANLDVPPGLVIPGRGVYAVVAHLEDAVVPGVANVGVRPTFGGESADVVEVHLLDYSNDLYGRRLEVDFSQRIRDERKFAAPDELIEQIYDDIAQARSIHSP